MTSHRSTLACLDLEGTLISNAVSQIPRPNLYQFLHEAHDIAQLVLFTSVSPKRTEEIKTLLVAEGVVPDWFADLDTIHPDATVKPRAQAKAHFPECRNFFLIDDQSFCIKQGEKDWWIAVKEYLPPYSSDDVELMRVLDELKRRCKPD